MEINIGQVLDAILNMDPEVVLTDKTAPVTAVLIVTAVISVLMCLLGLKLIRIWNILIGFFAGMTAGLAVSWAFNLENMAGVIVTLGAAVVLAVLGGVFKKFGVFVYTFVSIFGVAVGIIRPGNWILAAVCGGIGLIAAIVVMLVFEPLVIIVTSVNGGAGVGMAAAALAGLSNIYITGAIAIAAAVIGMAVQFSVRYREVAKKEVRHAEEIKEEISKAQEVEHLRMLLDDEEE